MNAPLEMREVQQDDRAALIEATAEDSHATCILPTHLWTRQGQIVGWASVNAAAFLNGWAHSRLVADDEAEAVLKQMEKLAAMRGFRHILTASPEDCRFHQFMTRQNGFIGGREDVKIFIKRITP